MARLPMGAFPAPGQPTHFLLDPSHVGVSLETIARAAKAAGKRVTFQIVDEKARRRSKAAANAPPVARGKSAKPARVPRKDVAQAG